MDSRKRTARLAGALYALQFTAPFVLIYLPGRVTVRGDPSATARNIAANAGLFELAVFAHLWNLVLFILLVAVLYQLLNPVGRNRAALMVILALVSLPLSFIALLADVGMLVLVNGSDEFASFTRAQVDSLAYFLLIMRDKALVVAQVFWGLWLLPMGMLVMRSRFLPRILGVLLILNGIAYPIISFTALFFPRYGSLVFNAMLPLLLGELWVMLWLVIKGTRDLGLESEVPSGRA